MALRARTPRDPADFHGNVIKPIENQLGRRRVPGNRNAARTIDIDIALWNDSSLEFGEPPRQVPDPDILRYAHVARPLAALDPDYRHPLTGRSLEEIAGGVGNRWNPAAGEGPGGAAAMNSRHKAWFRYNDGDNQRRGIP